MKKVAWVRCCEQRPRLKPEPTSNELQSLHGNQDGRVWQVLSSRDRDIRAGGGLMSDAGPSTVPPTPADPKREFKGVWICAALWEDTELNPTEKFLIAEVDSLCGNGKPCFASNEFLSQRLQTTPKYMNNMLYVLTQARYLVRLAFTGRHTLRCVHPLLSSNPAAVHTLLQKYKVNLRDGESWESRPHKRAKPQEGTEVWEGSLHKNVKAGQGADPCESSVHKNVKPESRVHKNVKAGFTNAGIQRSQECEPETSRGTKEKTTTTARVHAEGAPATEAPVVVVSSGAGFHEAQAESDAETLEDLGSDFGLNPEQAGKLRVYYKRHGMAYVEEKAELTRAEPRKNAAAFFMRALEKDWKAPVKLDKKAKPTKPEPSKEKAPARPDYSAQWELWQGASDEQREAWRQDHLIRQLEPKAGEKPRTAFLARLHGLTQPEGVAA
jgi:hypothetical protein